MKFLKTIRFDPSDEHVFENAAAPDEWAAPGGFTFIRVEKDDLSGKLKQAFSNGFVSLDSFGHSTFVSVAEIYQPVVDSLVEALAQRLETHYGAPTIEAARAAAQSEIDFVLELCSQTPINSIFTLHRHFDDDDEVREEFRIVDVSGAKPHARVWEVVAD